MWRQGRVKSREERVGKRVDQLLGVMVPLVGMVEEPVVVDL